MADLAKTIAIIFEGDDQVTRTISNITSSIDGFAGGVEDLTQPFADLAESLLKVEAAAVAMVAGGLAYAFKASKDFESAFIELKKVVGDNAEELETARLNAISLSDTYGESSKDILLSTAEFVQAGYNLNDAMLLTKNALDLVIAGNVDAARASEIFISVLKGFDAPASDSARLLDVLNEVSNKFATDVEQLAIGMADIAPIAKVMGFSFEETAGILTPVIEVFRSGSESARALKTGLLKLIDDASPVQEGLKSIGVSQRDLNGELRSGKEILLDVATAFQTANENDKLFLTQQLVGIDQSARMVKVFDNLAKTTAITAVATNSFGSAAAEVAARLQSSEVALKRFTTGFENLGVAVGDQFRVAATGAINGLTEIELALRNSVNSGSFKPVFAAIRQFSDELGQFFSQIAKNLPKALEGLNFGGLVKSFGELGKSVSDAFKAFFGDVDLTTVEGLRKTIQGIINSFTALNNTVSGIIEGLTPFIRKAGELVKELSSTDSETQKVAGQFLGLATGINKVAGLVGSFTSAFSVLSGAMATMAAVDVVKLIKGIDGLGSSVIAAGGVVGKLAGSAGLGALALAAGVAAGSLIRLIPGVDGAVQSFAEWTDEIFNWTGNQRQVDSSLAEVQFNIDRLTKSLQTGGNEFVIAADKTKEFDDILKQVQSTPTDISVSVDPKAIDITKENILALRSYVEENWTKIDFDSGTAENAKKAWLATIGSLTDTELEIGFKIHNITPEEFEKIKRLNDQLKADPNFKSLEDSLNKTIVVNSEVNKESLKKTKEEVTDLQKLANEKYKIDVDFQIAQVKAQADVIQKALEFQAQVDIAEIEAGARKIEAIMQSVGVSAQGASDVLTSIFSGIGPNGFISFEMERIIDRQIDIQEEALNIQKDLTEAQIALINAKREQISKGSALIQVEAAGLTPALEMIWQQIIEYSQVRATEEGLDILL